jgi:TPR repeat protein
MENKEIEDEFQFVSYGKKDKKEIKHTIHWYRKEAELGNISAQYKLGLLYHNGQNVEKNMKQAVYW